MKENKVSKGNKISIRIIERTLFMVAEIASKTVHKEEDGDRRGKRSRTRNEVKAIENTNINSQSFQAAIHV